MLKKLSNGGEGFPDHVNLWGLAAEGGGPVLQSPLRGPDSALSPAEQRRGQATGPMLHLHLVYLSIAGLGILKTFTRALVLGFSIYKMGRRQRYSKKDEFACPAISRDSGTFTLHLMPPT